MSWAERVVSIVAIAFLLFLVLSNRGTGRYQIVLHDDFVYQTDTKTGETTLFLSAPKRNIVQIGKRALDFDFIKLGYLEPVK